MRSSKKIWCIHFISFSVQCISKQHRPHNAWVTYDMYLSESFSESDHSHEANVAWMRNNKLTGEPGNVLVVLAWKCYLAWRSLLGKRTAGCCSQGLLPLSSINGSFKHIPDYNRASEPLTSRSQSTFLHLNTTVIRPSHLLPGMFDASLFFLAPLPLLNQ